MELRLEVSRLLFRALAKHRVDVVKVIEFAMDDVALVLSDHAGDIVHGELYRLREVDAMLREFDMYEACGEGFPEPTQYLRRMLSVTLTDGGADEAWTYIYNWPVEKLVRIESGRFLQK